MSREATPREERIEVRLLDLIGAIRARYVADPLLIVLDENIASEALCDALAPVAAKLGARVVMHTAFFPRETKDPV